MAAVAAVVALMAAGCGARGSAQVDGGATSTTAPSVASSEPATAPSVTTPSVTTRPDRTAPVTTGAPASGSGGLTLLTEPQAGLAPIYGLIGSARHTLEMTMYELRDATAEADLVAAARRGVDVRVILDQNRERSRNRPAYTVLTAGGVHVHWADPRYEATHQKTITVDGTTSAVMTLNLDSEYYATTRDFVVMDTDPADVAAIVATFDADDIDDIDAAVTPPAGADLVWSPTNAEAGILGVIDGARTTLDVENEEMDDSAVTAALVDAARRGVHVEVTMTRDSEWDAAFALLRAAGVRVSLYPDSSDALYIHAKAVVADAAQSDRRAFVGSENFSVASLRSNRELGLVTAEERVVTGLASVLTSDFAGGSGG